jgi:chromosome segregation ATPase
LKTRSTDLIRQTKDLNKQIKQQTKEIAQYKKDHLRMARKIVSLDVEIKEQNGMISRLKQQLTKVHSSPQSSIEDLAGHVQICRDIAEINNSATVLDVINAMKPIASPTVPNYQGLQHQGFAQQVYSTPPPQFSAPLYQHPQTQRNCHQL